MIVLKFGGTSVGNFEAVSGTMEIIASRLDEQPVVCVSALSKVTDLLYRIADTAAAGNEMELSALLRELRTRHLDLTRSLLSGDPEACVKASARVDEICDTLATVAESVLALGDIPDRIKATVISTGEILSSTIICYALNSKGIRTGFADARTMIVTDSDHLCGEPQFDVIGEKVPETVNGCFRRGTAFSSDGKSADGKPNAAVITQGFIAANRQGAATVLGRGGSDYSASIIGSALGVSRIEIWTDVDGIRTTDPRVCGDTLRIPRISYEEAALMARFGAKVLHPKTIAPAVARRIPVLVLNSHSPLDEGTAVVPAEDSEGPRGIAFKRSVYLVCFPAQAAEDVRGCLSEAKISPDIFTESEGRMLTSIDFSNDIGSFIRLAAAKTDVVLKTGFGQLAVIGRGLLPVAAELEKAVPQLKDNSGKLLSDTVICYIVAAGELERTVRDVHAFLFGTVEKSARAF